MPKSQSTGSQWAAGVQSRSARHPHPPKVPLEGVLEAARTLPTSASHIPRLLLLFLSLLLHHPESINFQRLYCRSAQRVRRDSAGNDFRCLDAAFAGTESPREAAPRAPLPLTAPRSASTCARKPVPPNTCPSFRLNREMLLPIQGFSR